MTQRWKRRGSWLVSAALLAGAMGFTVVEGGAGGAAALSGTACGTAGTPSVVAVHNPHFYVDSGQGNRLFSQYAGYSVRAGATGAEGLWLVLDGFEGGIVRLADGQSSGQALPNLGSGAASTRFYLLTADQTMSSGGSGIPQTHRVSVYAGSPSTGGTLVCSRTFTYNDVRETIKALANKVTSIYASGLEASTVAIGDAVEVTVSGNTGQVGAGPTDDPGVIDYTPNALFDFPADAWRLERTELSISPDGMAPAATYVNRLYLSGASGANRPYTAKYVFRAVGPTEVQAAVKPIQYIASGTQVKHTDLGSTPLFHLPSVSSVANVWVDKDADREVMEAGDGPVTYTVAVTNVGTGPGTIDEVVDRFPLGAAYVPGSARLDGAFLAEPVFHDGTMVFRGPFVVPASGQIRISYQLDLGEASGARVNHAHGTYAVNVIDGSRDVLHSEPAVAVVRVRGEDDDGPEAIDDVAATATSTPVTIDVLGNDVSPSGLDLMLVSATQPPSSAGVVTKVGSNLVFTPAASFAGRTTFTYTVTDGHRTDTASVTVDVAPTAHDDTFGGPPTTALRSYPTVLSNDVCPGCTVSLVTGPASGTLTLRANGTFDYQAATSNAVVITFTYRATLPPPAGAPYAVASDTATVTLILADVAPDYATTPFATERSVNLVANDNCSNCQVHNSNGSAPVNGTLVRRSPDNFSVRYTPYATVGNQAGGPSFWGIDRFTYGTTANAGAGTVTMLVGPPVLHLAAVSGGAAVQRNLATGVCDGCSFEFMLADAPSLGLVELTPAGLATYTPPSLMSGSTSFTYSVREPQSGLTVTGVVHVVVGPEAVDDHFAVDFGGSVSGSVLDNDSCLPVCTVTLVSPPPVGSLASPLDAGTGAFTYTAGQGVGDMVFTYSLASSTAPGISEQAAVIISVGGASDDHAVTDVATPVVIDVQANDTCGAATCTVTEVSPPSVGTAVVGLDGRITYTPPAGFSGQATFSYGTSLVGTSWATVTVDVRPVANPDAVSTLSGVPVLVLPLANDLCAGCTITAVGEPSSGSASVRADGRAVTFTPGPDMTGEATFTYTIANSSGLSASSTVTVSVASPPALADDALRTLAGEAATVAALENDSCTACDLEIATDPNRGAVSVMVNGTILYVPSPGFSGIDTFTYRATDPVTGAFGIATVTVTVLPIARDDSARTATSTPIVIDVQSNDACSSCVLTVVEAPSAEVAHVQVDGTTLSFTPAAGFTGSVSFEYRLTDPVTGELAEAQVTVVVDDAMPDAIATPYGTSVTGLDVLANDACDGCTLVEVGVAAGGSPTIEGSRTVGFVPAEGFAGLTSFSYTAEAGDGGPSVTSTVTVLVGPAARTIEVAPAVSAAGSVLAQGACTSCSVSLVTAPEHGEIDLVGDGAFSYLPPDHVVVESFVYRWTDAVTGLSVDGVVHVVPAPVHGLGVTKVLVNTDTTVSGSQDRLDAGDRLIYRITVSNTGTAPLSEVVVSDPLAATITCEGSESAVIAELVVGTDVACEAVVVLTQAQLDAGVVDNQAAASTAGEPGLSATSAVVNTPLEREPALTLAFTSAWLDDDVVHPAARIDAGDEAVYTLVATNVGNVTLNDPDVQGASVGVLVCAEADALAPGESMICTARRTITQTAVDAGFLVAEATANATDALDAPVTASAEVGLELAHQPSLSLAKLVTEASPSDEGCAAASAEISALAGSPITFCFSVVNTGNVTLDDVTIDDDALGLSAEGASATVVSGTEPLAPGASLLLVAESTVNRSYVNEARSRARTPAAVEMASAPAQATVTQLDPPTTTTTTTTVPPTTTTVPPTTTTTTTTTVPPTTTTVPPTTTTTVPPTTTTTVPPTTTTTTVPPTTVPPTTTTTTTTVPPTTTTTTTVPPTTTTTTTTTVPPTTTTTTTVPPTTTTTVPPTTTTTTTVPPSTTPTTLPPTNPEQGGNGSITGTVWFDRNQNGVWDPGEWALPGVEVTLEPVVAFSVPVLAAPGSTRTTVTDASGRYHLADVPPGRYVAHAAAPIRGFSRTFDTDGLDDWVVAVTVAPERESTADFSGIGHGELGGRVFDQATGTPVPGARVECRWAGLDDRFHTVDDVVFEATADGEGAFAFEGMPYGDYTCSGSDPRSGLPTLPVEAAVMSPDPVSLPLPIPLTTLPATGGDARHLAAWAMMLLLLGCVALLPGRRSLSSALVRTG